MKNIVLIGFMASGKTEVGKMLAQQLDYKFIDIDDELEKKLNMPIKKIHETIPLDQINDYEQDIVNNFYILKNQLIALNMKAVCNDHLMRILKHNSLVILLSTSLLRSLELSMKDEETKHKYRLIINGYNRVNHFQKCKKYSVAMRVLTDLNLLYKQYYDYKINVEDKSINMIVDNIITLLNNKYHIKY